MKTTEKLKKLNEDIDFLHTQILKEQISKNEVYIFELLKEKTEKLYYLARIKAKDDKSS